MVFEDRQFCENLPTDFFWEGRSGFLEFFPWATCYADPENPESEPPDLRLDDWWAPPGWTSEKMTESHAKCINSFFRLGSHFFRPGLGSARVAAKSYVSFAFISLSFLSYDAFSRCMLNPRCSRFSVEPFIQRAFCNAILVWNGERTGASRS